MSVYTRDYTGKLKAKENNETFTIIRRSALRISILRSLVDLIRGIRFIQVSRKKFDIYVSFQIQLSALIVVLGRLLFDIVALISPRGFEDFEFSPWPKRLFHKFLYRHCSHIMIQSPLIFEAFLKEAQRVFSSTEIESLRKKTFIFPNVIDSDQNKVSKSEVFQLIYVGRLIDYKGVEYLIDAVKVLHIPWQLVIVGDGPDRDRLKKLAQGLPINFIGEVAFDQVSQYLAASHILILPSLTENLPNVVLEAQALSLPVIATKVGALPELIHDGQNGFLVETRNAAQIADKIRILYEDKDLYQQMSHRALANVKSFLPETLLPLWNAKFAGSLTCKTVQT